MRRDVVRPPLPWPPPLPPPFVNVRTNESPLEIRSYLVEARVSGAFATVRTQIAFYNPNARVLEGELAFPLPDGAVVCGYALDVDGMMRDGVVVKKEKARVAFETEVKKGADPGLVEHVKGNAWNTRLYPIPAEGGRTIRLDYVTPLAFSPSGDAALVLPMPREQISERAISITVAMGDGVPPPKLGGLGDRRFAQAEACWRSVVADSDVVPDDDVVVALPALPRQFSSVENDGGETWFAVGAMPSVAGGAMPLVMGKSFRIVWDASGSRSPADIAKARAVIDALPDNAYYSLLVFRDEPEEERFFSSHAEMKAAVEAVRYDGGTDFKALGERLRSLKNAVNIDNMLFTDGMDTMFSGALGPDTFKGCTIAAFVSGSVRDMAALRRMCGGRGGDLNTTSAEESLRELVSPPRRVVALLGDGVADVMGIGQTVSGCATLVGRLTSDEATVRIDFGAGRISEPFVLRKSDAKPGRTLARARAARRVEELSSCADDAIDELMELGRRYSIASPATSLLVLDTLAQYLQYGVEPPATAKELHAKWLARRPDKAKDAASAEVAERKHLESLKKSWKELLKWRANPVPEKGTPSSGLFSAAAERFGRSVDVARREARAPARMVAEVEATAAALEEVPAPAALPAAEPGEGEKSKRTDGTGVRRPSAKVSLQAWDPKTPYLEALKAAPEESREAVYFEERAGHASSPAFFLDVAGFFFKVGSERIARRVLSNLAEMRLDDPALLRTYAWRLREAGDYDRAIAVLRRVAELRPEEPHSFRDLAQSLAERGKDREDRGDLEEAMKLLAKTAFSCWKRSNSAAVSLFALEELNALVAWCAARKWPDGGAPEVPPMGDDFKGLVDVDVRIVLSWDADNTDIDIHVLEPNGEEAFYKNRLTSSGGWVSRDITDGYGPEEYMQVEGQKGVYKVLTHYFGSSQQKLTGPATATATVYTNWGRKSEARQILSLRLEKPKEKVVVGEVKY